MRENDVFNNENNNVAKIAQIWIRQASSEIVFAYLTSTSQFVQIGKRKSSPTEVKLNQFKRSF